MERKPRGQGRGFVRSKKGVLLNVMASQLCVVYCVMMRSGVKLHKGTMWCRLTPCGLITCLQFSLRLFPVSCCCGLIQSAAQEKGSRPSTVFAINTTQN